LAKFKKKSVGGIQSNLGENQEYYTKSLNNYNEILLYHQHFDKHDKTQLLAKFKKIL